MYDINVKNVKTEINYYRFFLYIGILVALIINTIVILSIIKLKSLDSYTLSRYVEIQSYKDDDGDRMYTPIYYYNVNGETYKCKSSSSSNIKPEKTNGKVYYDSKNPEKCMTEYSRKSNKILIIGNIIPSVFIAIGGINVYKIRKKVKKIKTLNKTGKLIKNMPYYMENTNIWVNRVNIQRIVVDYQLPNGELTKLYSNPRYDHKYEDEDKCVDLLIDENNPENYFIDFEINRLSGNKEEDYYKKI